MTALRTVLVSMPFQQSNRPSIQLGLLKAIADRQGHPVRTVHANLDFAVRIGLDYYESLADHRGHQLGDWLFSVAAFGPEAPDPDGKLLEEIDLSYLDGPTRKTLLATQEQDIPAYLDALTDEFTDVEVAAFTSTFQQNTASFALARRLKERYPHIITIFGGANFDGEMGLELVRSVACIDIAVIGEGDKAFPSVLAALSAGEDLSTIPGVARRVGDEVVATPPAASTTTLDALPIPDYTEYFDRAARQGLPTNHTALPFESARGCWWGEKHHCTFCGLNGTTMRFRAKSPQRVLDELDQQSRRHDTFRFDAVDNILAPGYLKELLPALTETTRDYEIFYEVKANLTRPQLKALAAAGVTRLQPGLESLSSAVLSLMHKGVRAAQNVNLLRWARYYGITVCWNILWGFPGETPADYAVQTAAIPHLVHLQPPETTNRVWLERFSPLFTAPTIRWRTPERSYKHVYPSTVDIERIAYFFDYEAQDVPSLATYEPLREAVAQWSETWATNDPPVLLYRASPNYLQIYDGRPNRQGTYTFRDTLAAIYLACMDRPRTAKAVHRELDLAVPVTTVEDAFDRFAARGLMFQDDDLAVALALPATPGR